MTTQSRHTFEARGVISTCMSLPSSSWRGLKIALACWRFVEDENARFVAVAGRAKADFLGQALRTTGKVTLGRRKSRTGGGVLCMYRPGASCRNARAADDDVEEANCEQLLAAQVEAMVIHGGARTPRMCLNNAVRRMLNQR